jgi:hypothetical protein
MYQHSPESAAKELAPSDQVAVIKGLTNVSVPIDQAHHVLLMIATEDFNHLATNIKFIPYIRSITNEPLVFRFELSRAEEDEVYTEMREGVEEGGVERLLSDYIRSSEILSVVKVGDFIGFKMPTYKETIAVVWSGDELVILDVYGNGGGDIQWKPTREDRAESNYFMSLAYNLD